MAQGLYNLQETIDQLWGRAEGRQVVDAEIGIVHGHGGPLACTFRDHRRKGDRCNERRPDRIDWSQGLPLMAGPYFLGLYQPSPETKDFWDGVAQHELRLKWCANCARAHHPKRIVCTYCGNTELASKRAAGRGTVYSFSEVHRAAEWQLSPPPRPIRSGS